MIDRTRVNMAQGQPAEDEIVGMMAGEVVAHRGIADQIAMREHDSLGIAGRSRGVHDRGKVVRGKLGFSFRQLDLLFGQGSSSSLEEGAPTNHIVHMKVGVKDNDATQHRQIALNLANFVELGERGHE